jgi:hypothetical protein
MPPPDRPSLAADSSGQKFNVAIAVITLAVVLFDTLSAPFTTLDTVAIETPAILATSFTVHERKFNSAKTSFIVSFYLEEGLSALVLTHRPAKSHRTDTCF